MVKQQLGGFEKFVRRVTGKHLTMARLDGRVAIVTGGAKGIGRHYAQALAREGARLMIADVADGKDLADEIARDHGANSVASAITDVSDEGAVKALVAATIERFGKIDILVNNAALFAPLQEQQGHRDRRRAVGPRHGGQCARRVPDGQARRAAYDRAEVRQDHQYQFRHGRPRHSEYGALRHLEGRGHGLYPLAVAGTRRAQYLRQ